MGIENRFKTLSEAEERAKELTEETGEQHIAYKTNYVINPFAAERLPQIGDKVSKSFNGDSYPVGVIARISKTYNRITTDTGLKFTRVGPNSWKQGGQKGAFSLIQGHHSERNPHF